MLAAWSSMANIFYEGLGVYSALLRDVAAAQGPPS